MLWKFILVNSNNLSHIGELTQASGKKLEFVLNKPGSASFSYPMNGLYAEMIQPYKTGIKAMRYNRKLSEEQQRPVWECKWSGYVLPIDEAVSDNKMSVSCVGWLQRLARRFTRREKIYKDWDDGAIVKDLIDEANLTATPETIPYNVPIPPGSDPNTPTWMTWGGTQPDQGPGGATAYIDLKTLAAGRNKTLQKYSHILPAIEELNQIEYGGDIAVDPVTRAITWHRRLRAVKDDVVLGFQWGPQNVRSFGRNLEADSQINYIIVSGAAGTGPQYAEDVAQQAQIGLLEENVVLSDVKDNNILLTYAGAEMIIRSNGHITYQITPFPIHPDRRTNVVEPFIDFNVGDQVRLTAVHPKRINIRGQAVRIFGFSIDIDDNGVATIGPLQVAP